MMVIPFSQQSREKYYSYLDQIFDSNQWSHGTFNKMFEEKFEKASGVQARTSSSGGAGLLALLLYADVKDQEVIVPVNSFWATAVSVLHAGGTPVYADCNKDDLCLSLDSVLKKITSKTKAIVVTHIGGHLAFDIEKLERLCKEKSIHLIEDCAHAHGASFNGRTGGSFGLGGSYSFYATKTLTTGEGGMIVSHDPGFLDWYDSFKNYGKKNEGGVIKYPIRKGFNFRMNEMTAALGVVQMDELPKILSWKQALAQKYDQIFEGKMDFPVGMVSGYYKYIVFDQDLKIQTGKVYQMSDSAIAIENLKDPFPNYEWVAEAHSCAPIYYGFEGGDMDLNSLRDLLV